ncbi:hypothetical protein E1301_Tti021481 [Triplophysa tibetana]|uniref:C2H2-type domain-containing protein n=1 Tax=Triplophysa tibetana TaxID=1572043 RepID=A0A5A9P8Y2_9TELE|nr:hypothetical protein E1301_Tti021481 [Triplophysa tibetana]
MAGRPVKQAAMRKRRGCATSSLQDSLHAPPARGYGADGGQPGNDNFGFDGRLRECSVVLTRIRERAGATVGELSTTAIGLDTTGDARETAVAVQTAVEPGSGPAMVAPQISHVDAAGGMIICLPFEAHRCVLCGQSVGTLPQLKSHSSVRHPTVLVRFMCVSCGKTASRSQSIACHVPKCRGHPVTRPPGPVRCEACDATFETRRGCSIHEMHAHPGVRNRKRAADLLARFGPMMEPVEAGTAEISDDSDPGASTSSKRQRVDVSVDGVTPPEPEAGTSDPLLVIRGQESQLRERLRELVRVMVGEVEAEAEGEGGVHIPVLKAWLEGSDQIPALVTAATSQMLLELIEEARAGEGSGRNLFNLMGVGLLGGASHVTASHTGQHQPICRQTTKTIRCWKRYRRCLSCAWVGPGFLICRSVTRECGRGIEDGYRASKLGVVVEGARRSLPPGLTFPGLAGGGVVAAGRSNRCLGCTTSLPPASSMQRIAGGTSPGGEPRETRPGRGQTVPIPSPDTHRKFVRVPVPIDSYTT